MSIDKEEIIQIVAKEKGILLTKDDPILAFLAVHDVVLGSYADTIGGLAKTLEGKLESVSREYAETTEGVSAAIAEETKEKLKSTTEEVAESLRELLKDIVSDERQKYRGNLEKMVAEARQTTKKAIWATSISILCAGVAISSALLFTL